MLSPIAEPPPIAADLASARDAWAATAATIDRLNRTNPVQGLETAQAWLDREQAGGSPEGTARAMRAYAHAVRFLGRYEEAVDLYEDIEARFRALGLPAEAARTQLGHVWALRYTGRYQEAVDIGLQSQRFFAASGDDLQGAKVAINLGTVYRPMGRLRDAVRSYRDARSILRRLRRHSPRAEVDQELAVAEQNIGNILGDLGQYDDAFRHLRAAERIRRQLGLLAEVANTLLCIGILSSRRGDYGRALQALTEGGRIFETLGMDVGARLVDLQLLPTCVALNLREESSAAAERAIDGLRRLAMPSELGQALLWAGQLADANGDLDLARERTAEARSIFGEVGNRLWEDLARLEEIRLLAHAGLDGPSAIDHDALYQGLVASRGATQSLEQAGAVDRAVFGLLVEGAVLSRLQNVAEAQACYERALEAAERLHADHLLFQAHEALGGLQEASDPEAAAASFRRAIDHLESVRSRTVVAELKVAFLADKVDVYERLVGLLISDPTPAAIGEALGYVERSKSRALLDDLLAGTSGTARSRRSRVARLAKRVRDLQAQLRTAYLTAYQGNAVPADDSLARLGTGDSIADLEAALARASRDLELAQASADPDGGRQHVAEAALSETPLPPGDVLIEYYSVGSDLLAFVRRGADVALRTVAAIEDVQALVDKLSFQIGKCSLGTEYVREHIENLRRGTDRCLHNLYRQVIEPIGDLLADGDRLIVVPHGALHGLPFHAFHDGEAYLVDRYAITVAPSAAVMHACRQVARPIGDRALVVGIDDPGLPSVPQEVEAIRRAWESATVAMGSRATSRVLRRQTGTFDVLHLATHGVFRADNPSFSSIKLADGWLTVRDLAEVARGAQLVTLSACETGVSGITAGDEVIGLTRGLLGAGCSAVVASLWTVSDESTARLMGRFYASLRAGEAPAVALQSAMLAIRAQYDHPYFWAPFVVIGDGLTDGAPDGAAAGPA